MVFVPDIHYQIGEPGKSAYNAVVSAAIYLSKNKWIDFRRMGLAGHSFGGYETNFIVTHTNMFSAALSASSVCDIISQYGSISYGGFLNYRFYESWQGRMGVPLWGRIDLYIKNSPIFDVKRVSTPLLLMNNEKDGIVNFSQGVEFFLALRRFHKKVWMLQYDDEGHSLSNKKNVDDFTNRITQFFDYYLKDAFPPKWMTQGVPAIYKGIIGGYEQDQSRLVP